MERVNVGGWLLLLCALLLVWQPTELAIVSSSAVDQIAFRGPLLALALAGRTLVTALGIAAGIALLRRHPGAPWLAKASLVASALADVATYTTSVIPSNRMPGDAPIYVAASLVYYGLWLVYLGRSRRVRETFP